MYGKPLKQPHRWEKQQKEAAGTSVSWMSARTAPLEQLDHEELQRQHAQLLRTVRSFSPGAKQLHMSRVPML